MLIIFAALEAHWLELQPESKSYKQRMQQMSLLLGAGLRYWVGGKAKLLSDVLIGTAENVFCFIL